MNIEELELSLRSEFEGQLNSVVARLRQDVADFQEKFQAEFQKHREQMDRSIDELATRLPESYPLESAFKSTITEHLRLARDEGAQIAATAFGEAEKLKTGNTFSSGEAKYDLVRDAINDITSRRSQAAILTALVDHAARFAPRGAFFIVKNDNFVGWKAFGTKSVSEESVREIRFKMSFDPFGGGRASLDRQHELRSIRRRLQFPRAAWVRATGGDVRHPAVCPWSRRRGALRR